MPRTPRWENELWSYISTGNGIRCPLYDCCQIRKQGGWCPDENKEKINQLLDEGQFIPHSYDFIESEAKGYGRLCQLVEMLAQKHLKIGKVHHPPVPAGIVTLFDL